jgi:DNA-binding helix-hairpin-helix protein with protein kinase domain
MPKLAEGGEGIIYKVAEPPGQVLKHYLPKVLASNGPVLAAKVQAMVSNQPKDPTAPLRHCSLAWPQSLVIDTTGQFAGYLMPAIDHKSSVELHMVSNPSDRKRSPKAPPWLAGFTWEYLLRVAMNLAAATQALHDASYIIGDFNERNVLVRMNTLVSLVDCDSMQVPNPQGKAFLCSVYRPEFTAPELLRVNLSQESRTIESDRFPLAIHIYQLLMEGRHPYAGVWHGSGDKPKLHELATRGLFVQKGDKGFTPQAGTPPFDIFPSEARELFIRAFSNGATDPSSRPDGLEWYHVLESLAETLVTCQDDEAHRYPGHLGTACPWCKLDKGSQVATAGPPRQVPLPPAVAPPPRPHPGQAYSPSQSYWQPAGSTRPHPPVRPRWIKRRHLVLTAIFAYIAFWGFASAAGVIYHTPRGAPAANAALGVLALLIAAYLSGIHRHHR